MKRVLMVAYHFPPYNVSSGVQRTLRFVEHLPAFGWQPVVLTVRPHAYDYKSDDLVDDIPEGVHVERTFALDAARHIALAGRYPAFLARPDRWKTWQFSAIPAGLRLIRKLQPHVIWSTYPIATAHLIGRALQRRTGLPWIADFRDPMAQVDYPADPKTWCSFKRIEEQAIVNAAITVTTTPSAARLYRERYPIAAERIVVLENGYDEASFRASREAEERVTALNPGAITLLHSGIVYPSERDPTQFFAALARLAADGIVDPRRLKIRFRGAMHETMLRDLLRRFQVEAFVQLMQPLAYQAALKEMTLADGLLILQAANCNEQIPAKLYEYLRCNRPILALTDHRGDTAQVLRNAGIDTIAALDSADDIVSVLPPFLHAVAENRAPLPDARMVLRASRRLRTEVLSQLLESVLPRKNSSGSRSPVACSVVQAHAQSCANLQPSDNAKARDREDATSDQRRRDST
jgi:glycosyltransferase involved in cell wall biosynthesis